MLSAGRCWPRGAGAHHDRPGAFEAAPSLESAPMRQQQLAALALRSRRRRAARRGAAMTFLFALTLFGAGGGAVALDRIDYYAADLPDPSNLNSENLPQATQILDRRGRLLYVQQPQGHIRTVVPLARIALVLRRATVDIEDRNFY